MEWYKSYRLVKDGDSYIVEIVLNPDSAEFSQELLENINVKLLEMDSQISKFVNENFKGLKINYVKLMVGTLIVASIPFIAQTTVQAAEVTPSVAQQVVAQTTGVTVLDTTGIVTATQLNMRSGPGTTYSITHVLWQGNKVKVIGKTVDWYQIQLSDGSTGWVSNKYLQVDLAQQKIDLVIASATALIGTPYVWGGASLNDGGFDCSGFTQYVFAQAGYTIARTSSQQALNGTLVNIANLKPGDLVFFSFNQNGIVDHVGLYIGNGKMINSPKTGDVVKTVDITTSYWQVRLVTARRII